jgi:hypothetical protein
MKRIVRLTESDLTRIVRRVIRESKGMINEGNGAAVANEFIAALSKWDDDEAGALIAMKKIKDRASLVEFSKQITAKTGKGWCEYLNSEMSDVDVEYTKINDHTRNLGGGDCTVRSTVGKAKDWWNRNTMGSWGVSDSKKGGGEWSDKRVKNNINKIGESPLGINIYEFTYKWDSATKYVGVMAQELLGTKWEDAVILKENGYYSVDYSKIDVDFVKSEDHSKIIS